MIIRPALPDDLPGIMAIEAESFGDGEMSASEALMRARIEKCNSTAPHFFWVAEHQESIVADIVAQPTNFTADECTSWEKSTDDGTLENTFDRNGHSIYIASLGALKSAPPGATDLLVHQSLLLWLPRHGTYMFSARMPGFQQAKQRTDSLTPIEYYMSRHIVANVDKGPRDKELRYYYDMFGQQEPYRLNLNGWQADEESGGHGVLFALMYKEKALHSLASRIYTRGREALINEQAKVAAN